MSGMLLYPLGAALSLLLSAWAWDRGGESGVGPTTPQRHAIFFGCLVGVVVGAKLGYLLAEGWMVAWDARLSVADRALRLLQGKTVTGGLIGAYAGVELAKQRVAYRHATGDSFALLAPASLAISRLGCWAQGCCLGLPLPAAAWTLTDAHGVSRWPAVPLEFAFNLAFLAWVAVRLTNRRVEHADALSGQLFHVYLMAYGLFRFAHEFMRDTPRWYGQLSGYHLLAAAVFGLGCVGYVRRRASRQSDGDVV